MNEIENGLIPVYENEDGKQLVNARELHKFLEVKTRFNDWIYEKLKKYKFVKDVDFTSFTENPVKPTGGRPKIEYILTLETAKELSMVEENEKGREARRYFISVEEKYKKLKDQRIKELEHMVNVKLSDMENRVKELEDTKVIDYTKQLALQNLGKSKAVTALGGINSPAYRDKHLRSKVFFSLWGGYKNKFAVNSYKNTSVKDFEAGRSFLTNWKPSRKLAGQIQMKNGQTVIHI